MKVYIAAPWKDREGMSAIAGQVEGEGHTITHKWWDVENTPEGPGNDHILRQQAILDVEGVKKADIVLLINSAKSEGKSLEQGVAIAGCKLIVAVGKRGEFSKNVFHYLDNYKWVDTVSEAVDVLNQISDLGRADGRN